MSVVVALDVFFFFCLLLGMVVCVCICGPSMYLEIRVCVRPQHCAVTLLLLQVHLLLLMVAEILLLQILVLLRRVLLLPKWLLWQLLLSLRWHPLLVVLWRWLVSS